jgi:lipopolysaccharide export system ATP-binding protein
MSKLTVENIAKRYGGRKVVDEVSLNLESGTVVGLLGPNGAGKTTTFYLVVGLVRPDSGRICIDQQDITHDPMHLRARKGIGYLPQETSVFRKLSVHDNIMGILEFMPLDRQARQQRTSMLLEELGIAHLAAHKATVLSGGEKRRLEIARTLATDPAFILLDEPFAGIDPLAVLDIKQIITHLKQRGIGVMISDHNVRETLEVCDRAYILNDGQVIESGPPEKIIASKTARRIYLGDEFRL